MFANVYKYLRNCRYVFKPIGSTLHFSNQVRVRLCKPSVYVPQVSNNKYKTILGVSLLGWLGFVDDDDKKESELIIALKRGVLAYNREEYSKAEQLLHVALRIAQDLDSEQGITYCYDIMANVALDHHKLDKAEKLFIKVMERLLRSGIPDNDLKVIHIGLKLSRIYHLHNEKESADLGFKWCLKQIANQQNSNTNAKMLYGVINDWYAQYLLDLGDVQGSLAHLKEAYSICSEMIGENSVQSMLLLNDIATTTWRAGDSTTAQTIFDKAIKLGNQLDDKTHLGVVHANLGLIYLEKGVIKMAQKYCKEALELGQKHKNRESINQANYCFEQIKVNEAK